MGWLDWQIDWDAYNLGFKEWDKFLISEIRPLNPFEKDSDKWYSWNKGFNNNFNGCD